MVMACTEMSAICLTLILIQRGVAPSSQAEGHAS